MLEAQSTLGLGKRSIPYVADVYCEAVGRDSVAQHVLAHSSVDAQIHEPAMGKREWRYCPDESGRDVFFAFANRGTSCSMRRFAARDGVFLEPASTRKGTFQTEFRDERTAGQLVNGPEAVSIVAIPAKLLCSMRAEAGLPDAAHIEGAVQMPRSLLSGFDALIDRRLGVEHIGKSEPHYPQTKAHRYVSDLDCIDGIALVSDGYQLIEGNWPGCRCRSKENWRWEKRLHISDENDSAEKRFEKAVTAACAEWMNMIPVASGVMPDAEEGGRRIDLARCFAPGCYEFVELKLGRRTDTPLRAAVEILGYGLIYVFSRVHANALGYDNTRDLLAADRISLKATLPRTAYVHGSLANLEAGLNEGLANLTDRLRLPCSVDFAFEALPEGASEQRPRESMERRYRMYSSV